MPRQVSGPSHRFTTILAMLFSTVFCRKTQHQAWHLGMKSCVLTSLKGCLFSRLHQPATESTCNAVLGCRHSRHMHRSALCNTGTCISQRPVQHRDVPFPSVLRTQATAPMVDHGLKQQIGSLTPKWNQLSRPYSILCTPYCQVHTGARLPQQ